MITKSNSVKWYIQDNINEKDSADLKHKLLLQNIHFESFYHIPFDNTYPEIDITRPVFFYVAHEVTNNIINTHGLGYGVFYNTDDIDLSVITQSSPNLMWNQPFFTGSFQDLMNIDLPEKMFLRPALDNKVFSGVTKTKSELIKWFEQLKSNETLLNVDNEIIMVSDINLPSHEYRLIICDSQVVTGSLYCVHGEKKVNAHVPDNIVKLAQKFTLSNKQVLPRIFCLDIAESLHKSGIIEINSIHNAGFYEIDKVKWIEAINQVALESYQTRIQSNKKLKI